MATLIPNYALTDFKKLEASEIRKLKSCELTSDGEFVCTVVIPQTDYIRLQVENLAQLGNAVGGEIIEQLLAEEKPKEEVPVPPLPKHAGGRPRKNKK